MIRVSLDIADSIRGIRQLRERAPKAIARAMNRSMDSGRTVMVRVIAKDMGLKQKDIRDRVVRVPATPEQLVAKLRASTKPIPIYRFGARGPYPSRGKGSGVTWRNQGQRKRDPHAFIAQMRTGHIGVFKRVPGARRRGPEPDRSQLPIFELMGPSIYHVFVKHRSAAEPRIHEQLVKNLRHELRFALRREGA